MTPTVDVPHRADTSALPPRPVVGRVSDALTAHLHPRTIGLTGGVLLALGLGYAWATLLFLQAGRGQLVVSYGLPALVLTTTGALGLTVFLRSRQRSPSGAARWRTGLARTRLRSSVRPGRSEGAGDEAEPTDTAAPRPSPVPRTAPDEASIAPARVDADATAPIHRAPTAPPAPTMSAPTEPPMPAADPMPPQPTGRHAWVDATPQTTPMHAITPPPAPLRVVPDDPSDVSALPVEVEPSTSEEHASGELDAAPSTHVARVGRVRPTRRSGEPSSRTAGARPRRVAGRPARP